MKIEKMQVLVAGNQARNLAGRLRWLLKCRVEVEPTLERVSGGVASNFHIVVLSDFPGPDERRSLEDYQAVLKETVRQSAQDKSRLVIWLSVPTVAYPDQGEFSQRAIQQLNTALKRFSAEQGAYMVPLSTKLLRWGPERFLKGHGYRTLNRKGLQAAAIEIAQEAMQWWQRRQIGTVICPHLQGDRFQGLDELYRQSPGSADELLLKHLTVQQLIYGKFDLTTEKDNEMLNVIQNIDDAQPESINGSVWNQPGQDQSWQSQFLALEFLRGLIADYQKSSRVQYLARALALVFAFRDSNPVGAPLTTRSWHEGTATNRLYNLALLAQAYVSYARNHKPDESSKILIVGEFTQLIAFIEQHLNFLMLSDIYKKCGNHGLRQDTFILYTSTVFPDFLEADRWKRIAKKRVFAEQLIPGFSADGVWLEHSPGYHEIVKKLVAIIYIVCRYEEDEVFSSRIKACLDQMQLFTEYVVKPNACLPEIGDTASKKPMKKFYDLVSPAVAYSLTQGNEGQKPETLDAIFQDGGWAIMRDRWGSKDDFTETIYVNFHATFHSAKHKHTDDLSFILFGKGRDWIIDPGKYNYEVEDPVTHHFSLDASAHNIYTIDNKGYQPNGKASVVGIRDYVSMDQEVAVTAENGLYQAGKIQRTLIFLRDLRTVILVDQLNAKRVSLWDSHLHLAPDLNVVPYGQFQHCAVDETTGWRMDIVTDRSTTDETRIAKGQENPLLGWTNGGWSKAIPAPVLIHSYKGKRTVRATGMRIRAADELPLSAIRLNQHRNQYDIELNFDGRMCSIRLITWPRLKVIRNN